MNANSTYSKDNLIESSNSQQPSISTKYRKFNSTKTYQPQIKRQIIVQNLQGSQRDMLNRRLVSRYGETALITRNNSQNNLTYLKSLKKLPLTPRKQIHHLHHNHNHNHSHNHYHKGRSLQQQNYILKIKQIMYKFQILMKDIEKLLYDLQLQIKRTTQQILKNAQKQISKFLKPHFQFSQKSKNLFENITSLNNSYQNAYPRDSYDKSQGHKILDELINQKKYKNAQSIVIPSQISPFCSPKSSMCQQTTQPIHKTLSLSHMIQVKQRIKHEALVAKPKNRKIRFEQQQPIMVLDQQQSQRQINGELLKSISYRRSPQRDASKSIQKLQKQLKSLKNLLNQ